MTELEWPTVTPKESVDRFSIDLVARAITYNDKSITRQVVDGALTILEGLQSYYIFALKPHQSTDSIFTQLREAFLATRKGAGVWHVIVLNPQNVEVGEIVREAQKSERWKLTAARSVVTWGPREVEKVIGTIAPAVKRAFSYLQTASTTDLENLKKEQSLTREDSEAFHEKTATVTPYFTWSLAIFNAAMFALQYFFGHRNPLLPASKMGAAIKSLILEGEWWRLLTSTVLHANIQHVALNLFALFSFGTFLERALGHRRYALLYFASGLGGSLLSLARPTDVLGVGASGGIWGLMVAGAVLGSFENDLIPRNIAAQMRRRGWYAVAVNAAYSFAPGIDLLAHLGGGLIGGALSYFAIRQKWLPELNVDTAPSKKSHALTALTVVSIVTLLSAIGLAFSKGQPWAMFDKPSLERFALQDRVSFNKPPLQLKSREKDSWVFGDVKSDGMVIVVQVFDFSDVVQDDVDPEAVMQRLLAETKFETLAGYSMIQAPAVEGPKEKPFLHSKARAQNQATMETFIVRDGKTGARFDFIFMGDEAAEEWVKLNSTIAQSFRSH